jgi:Outer membrane protein beta-barrel domain
MTPNSFVRAIVEQFAGSALLVLLLAVCPVAAAAQGRAWTSVFVFGSTGNIDPDDAYTYWVGPTWATGGGVERRFASGVLVQGEVELLQRPRSPGEQLSFLPSVNIGFSSGSSGVRPFVTGGFTLVEGSAIFNVGGGANISLQEHVAVRAEFRNYRMLFDVPINSYELRIGLAFR